MPWTYPPNYRDFSSADEYMRYWLAWEYKANPCYYRIHANCMGAALEVSYLYTKPWRDEIPLSASYLGPASGYGAIEKWHELVKTSLYFHPAWEMKPGTLFVFAVPAGGLKLDYVHMAVLASNSEEMCFEKQSPHLPNAYYQFRFCKDILLEYPPLVYLNFPTRE
ncbi:MAG TPA: hypothetical protein ENN19_17620 [Chloroflexi bacterium]|nr:hypothetical protein [Chloroflexota bacterium]